MNKTPGRTSGLSPRPSPPEVLDAFLPSSLPLSRSTLRYLTRVLRRHRARIGSKNRALTAGQQALMTLAYLKKGETVAQLAAGFRSVWQRRGAR
jgi:hypothetical protein